jgi:hypothetical protein
MLTSRIPGTRLRAQRSLSPDASRGRDGKEERKVGNSHLWANEIVVRWGE